MLGTLYGFSAARRCDVIESLLASAEVVVQAAASVGQAVTRARANADLADALLHAAAVAAGAAATMTFDKDTAKKAGMTLI